MNHDIYDLVDIVSSLYTNPHPPHHECETWHHPSHDIG